ncbi:MAG: hypothetical protein GY928_32430 [Colwellia sp.]|nr:hypothetical protein [Colwellia sp.]
MNRLQEVKLSCRFIKTQLLSLMLLWSLSFSSVKAIGNDIFFDSGQDLGSEWSNEVALGDLDGDGDSDVFIANHTDWPHNGANHVWKNDGTGVFTNTGQSLGNSRSREVLLSDLDGDGDLDAFVANNSATGSTGTPNKVWLNNGTGVFSDSGQALGNAPSFGLALGDIDNDGDIDAVAGNHGGCKVLWNNGSAIFTDSGQVLSGTNSPDVELGDLDGDSDLDLFIGNHGTTPSFVYFNDGSGIFTDSGQALGSLVTWSISLGDLDGDGDLDAFLANSLASYAPGYNTVWFNDGSGFFSDSGQSLGNAQSNDVALGDIDGDGDLDAYAPNHVGVADEVWFNDGNGYYTIGQSVGSANGQGVGLGDLDGDGDIDAVVVNWGQSNRVLFNTTLNPDGTIGVGGGTVVDTEGTGASFSVDPGVLPGNTNITINVIPDPGVSPPPGFIGPATQFVDFTLSPNPSPLTPPGAIIVLPLAFTLPPGTTLSLFKYDPSTGSLTDTGVVGTVNTSGIKATFTGVITFSIFVALQVDNQPPVAVCRDITISADTSCNAYASIDNGSYDPDGDEITITHDPAGPYGLEDTIVTLTVIDDKGKSDSCVATVTVVDTTAPKITASLVPVKIKKRKGCFTVKYSATDNCDEETNLSAVLNGYPVYNGQRVKLKQSRKFKVKVINESSNEDDSSGSRSCDAEVKFMGHSFTLIVTATDDNGNTGTKTVEHVFE